MSRSPERLLPLAAALTVLAGALALPLGGRSLPPPALWHLVFAIGALPMMLAAMAHFVPVLTRSEPAPPGVAAAPLTALAAGALMVVFFAVGLAPLRLVAPWLGLAAVAGFGLWLARRWRGCLGRPHPCLAWYAAALACLGLGLTAVAVAPWLPQWLRPLRLFHIHVNTLGGIGLTAIGTLQVLLPTVAGKPDPQAGPRLAADLKWSLGGVLAIAAGAALAWPPLLLAGAAAYAWPPLRLLAHAWRSWRAQLTTAGTVLPLLGAAPIALVGVVVQGALHGVGGVETAPALPLFVVGFLLPLVSGAAGQLLPVWLRPGVQGAWHRESRRLLARGARTRAALLLTGGLLGAIGSSFFHAFGIAGGIWLLVEMAGVAFHRNRPIVTESSR